MWPKLTAQTVASKLDTHTAAGLIVCASCISVPQAYGHKLLQPGSSKRQPLLVLAMACQQEARLHRYQCNRLHVYMELLHLNALIKMARQSE